MKDVLLTTYAVVQIIPYEGICDFTLFTEKEDAEKFMADQDKDSPYEFAIQEKKVYKSVNKAVREK